MIHRAVTDHHGPETAWMENTKPFEGPGDRMLRTTRKFHRHRPSYTEKRQH